MVINMKKLISISILLAIAISFFNTVYADVPFIECSTVVNGRNVSLSGKINGVNSAKQITLLVGDLKKPDSIVYINQKETEPTGEFSFEFCVPEKFALGEFQLRMGSDSGSETYSGIIDCRDMTVEAERKFIETDVDVIIERFVPRIEGTLNCGVGKTLYLEIINTTDQTVVANDTITSANGVYNLSYTLPSLIYPKNYTVNISCTDGEESIVLMNVGISSSTVLLKLSGTAETAENVRIDARLQSNNSGLVDKSTSFSGNKEVSVTIPNLLANMSFHLEAEGYETVDVPIVREASKIYEVSENQKIYYFVTVDSEPEINRQYIEITYPQSFLSVDDLCIFTKQKETGPCVIKNCGIEIISSEPGKIIMKSTDSFPAGKYLKMLLSGISFNAVMTGTAEISCKITQ